MRTLLLRLAGPLQAWGDSSRFTERQTRREPTKSGVLGLLAAAQGLRRTDPVEDLISLDFAVRIDQEGTVLSDFQTAINWETGQSMPLSRRYYLADAVFVAGVGGDPSLIQGLADAVRSPVWAPFLGRRACPPAWPLYLGVAEGDVRTAVRSAPWQAANWYRRQRGSMAELRMYADAQAGETRHESIRDVPRSYDPRRREHGWRDVVEESVTVRAPQDSAEPDFMTAVEL
ncbi:type I-E CRISPR-associated protein Cas5/CasD [Ornithinimicrobium cavernae]|uniref:type I-E CRISPR-associated protein Cas5/CasD n=1 Tax=Ornithinimicrobium cavernae TaxID=2666047 RepID=UPI000D695ED6|nr:type I-E CRISPR-associated protein Cas5/CasD [Ornithinimicrobium cavernae]